MKKLFWTTIVLLSLSIGGCNNDILDPTQIGRFEPTPGINVILNTLGVADEPAPSYESAEDPSPEDLIPYEQNYVLKPGDIVRIGIFELFTQDQNYTNDYQITESGQVSIPDAGLISAAGLTEIELEQKIANILSPRILKDPAITVSLLQSQSRYFTIVGQGVTQSSRFEIPRHPIHLLEAIAYAGGIGDFNVSYIYVSRDIPLYDSMNRTQSEFTNPDNQFIDKCLLKTTGLCLNNKKTDILISMAAMDYQGELEKLAAPEGLEINIEEEAVVANKVNEKMPIQQASRIEWIFEDGRWKPVEMNDQISESIPSESENNNGTELTQAPDRNISSDFGFSDLGGTKTITRVIKIPVDRLLAGDSRYNIIIQPGDSIAVPRDVVGEFYIGGNVNAPNVYALTGRPITLKQAIVVAGGLNQIAYPKKVEVVRRLGKNKAGLWQEESVLVDLDKIAKGIQPDFFIKPFDYINVGTHGTSRYLAVLRNAFRATYGFGLIYDRNFAYSEEYYDR